MELNDLMHLHDLTVVLVHNSFAADALKVFATRLVNYDEFIKDVNPPSQQQQVCREGSRFSVMSGFSEFIFSGVDSWL